MTVIPMNPVRGDTPAPGPAGARIDALLASAEHEVLVMSSLTSMADDRLGAIRRVDHALLRRGVRYRLVVPDASRVTSVLGPRLGMLALAGADTRTIAEVPTDAVVVDGSVVVLPTGDRTSGPASGVATFRLPGVVTTTVELFERVWPTAVPLVAYGLPEAADLAVRERELLALLSAGCTDDSAATRLGVSVRTVRRMVADIMHRLGARSRFQAGVKAADRGWLLEQAG